MFKFLQAATLVALANGTELNEWMTRIDDILLQLDEDNFDTSEEGLAAKNLMVQAKLDELLHINDKMDLMMADDYLKNYDDQDLLELTDEELLQIGEEENSDDEEEV